MQFQQSNAKQSKLKQNKEKSEHNKANQQRTKQTHKEKQLRTLQTAVSNCTILVQGCREKEMYKQNYIICIIVTVEQLNYWLIKL